MQQNYQRLGNPMDSRSKSAYQKRQSRETRQIQEEFKKLLFCRQESPPTNNKRHPQAKEFTFQKPIHDLKHHQIQKVQSYEEKELIKNRSAIEELEVLVTPRRQEDSEKKDSPITGYGKSDQKPFNIVNIIQNSVVEEIKESEYSQNLNESASLQHYKQELKKVTKLYHEEEQKNMELIALIKRLEHYNKKAEQELNYLIISCRGYESKKSAYEKKIEQLQGQFKKQLIINLELQECMVKMTSRKGKGDVQLLNKHISMLQKTLEEKDKHYERELMKIKRELEDAAKIGQQQIDQLINIINCKTSEINRLNSRLKDNRIEVETLPSHQNLDSHLLHLQSPRQEKAENYVERYAHFAKQLEAKLQNKAYLPSTKQSMKTTVVFNEIPELNLKKRKGSANIEFFKPQKIELSESYVRGELTFLKAKNGKLQELLRLNEEIYQTLQIQKDKMLCKTDRV